MKKILTTVIAALIFSIHSFAQIHISGGLSGVLADTTYIVDGDIYVISGAELEIEPGAVFLFDGDYNFEIDGTLICSGTTEDSIYFLPNEGVDSWGGIVFNDFSTSNCILEYCIISGSNDTGLKILYSSPQINNCTISGNEGIDGGGIYTTYSNSVIQDCVISDNSAENGGGLYLWRFAPTIKRCIISDNFAQNMGGGVQSWFCNPNIQNTTIYMNRGISGAGINLAHSGSVIVNCIVSDNINGAGINLTIAEDSRITYSDFFNNQSGSFSGNLNPGLGILTQVNANEDSCDNDFNIFLDPEYINPEYGNLGISWVSACIDAGNPVFPLDPDNTTPDIGAIYFDQNGPNPPMPFDLISPSYGDTSSTGEMTIIWEESVDPDNGLEPTYDVLMDTLADFSTAWTAANNINESELQLTNLDDDRDYYWKVHANDTNTPGTWSNDSSMFTVFIPEPLQPFDLVMPEDMATLTSSTTMFYWDPAVDPDQGDIVDYTLYFLSGSDSVEYYIGTSYYKFINLDTVSIITNGVPVEWYVEAHSSYPEMTIECNDRFTFMLPLGVDPVNGSSDIPQDFILRQNIPNPFNESTTITFGIPVQNRLRITLYDVTGKQVDIAADAEFAPGYHSVVWDAAGISSGIYFLRLESTTGVNRSMKIILLR